MASAQTSADLLARLVDEFRFPADHAREAIDALGKDADLESAIGWLLDSGAEDRGGAVTLRHCPHADRSAFASPAPFHYEMTYRSLAAAT